MTALALVVDETPEPTAPFTVQPFVEQERDGTVTHAVEVTLSPVQWRMLVGDVARRVLATRSAHLVIAAGRPTNDLARVDALTALMQRVGQPPTFVLTPDQAGDLAEAIFDAALDPVVCACGAVVQQPTQLRTTCGGCVDRKGGE